MQTPETAVSLGLNHMDDCCVYKLKAAIPLTNDAEPTGRPAGGLMWAGLASSYY